MHTGYWGLRYNTPVVFCNAISSSSSSSMRWGTATNAIIGFYTFCGEASALTWEAICQRGDKIQIVKLQCGSSIAPDEMSCHCTGSKTSWSIPDLQNSHWQHFDDIHVEIRWFFSDEFLEFLADYVTNWTVPNICKIKFQSTRSRNLVWKHMDAGQVPQKKCGHSCESVLFNTSWVIMRECHILSSHWQTTQV